MRPSASCWLSLLPWPWARYFLTGSLIPAPLPWEVVARAAGGGAWLSLRPWFILLPPVLIRTVTSEGNVQGHGWVFFFLKVYEAGVSCSNEVALLGMPTACIRVSVSSPRASTSDLASHQCTSWEATIGGSGTWVPATHGIDPDGVPWPNPGCGRH